MYASIPFPNIEPWLFQLPGFDLFGMHLGPFPLRWYALAYIAGLVFGWRYMVHLVKTERVWARDQKRPSPVECDDFLFWATLGVIVGGRLGYVVFYGTSTIWEAPLKVFAIWEGGMSFHGGLIGVGLAIYYFARKAGTPLLTLGDIVAACAPIGLFFGRLANFVNGELWGRPTDLPWGVIFPNSNDGLPRHPSQLYEAALEGLVLFAVLRLATHQFEAFKRPGLTTGLFLIGYGLVRVALENVREPDRQMLEIMQYFPFGMTMGMMLSIPMIAIGAWLVWRALQYSSSVVAKKA